MLQNKKVWESMGNPTKSKISKAMESMALLNNDAKRKLEKSAKQHNYSEWKFKCTGKSSGVGFLTGLTGGPQGIALEVADTGYLISMSGRACYGVGHILNHPIDYDKDIDGILAIWSGIGRPLKSSEIDTGGVLLVGGKIAVKVSTKVASKATGKIVSKIAAKAGGKIIAKASGKIAGKIATKVSTKWIPVFGGMVSAGINWWVIDGLVTSAKEYYETDYIILSDEIID